MSVERNKEIELSETKRPVNPGAERWLGEKIHVLDHGFIYLVDYLGTDKSFVDAARASNMGGTKKTSEDVSLIRYLRRNHHTSPFEMAEMVFHAKMPIMVARQWVRHRTASLNEESARYSILKDEFYVPDPTVIAIQSKSNNQGREDVVPEEYATEFRVDLEKLSELEYQVYERYLNDTGNKTPLDADRPMIARELSRLCLGVNFYTEWYWKCDLHNIFHFLRLRTDSHAQWEIRQYADAMARIVADSFPVAWKAFQDYELDSYSLSVPEQDVLKSLILKKGISITVEEAMELASETGLTNKRERQEMIDKFVELGVINHE